MNWFLSFIRPETEKYVAFREGDRVMTEKGPGVIETVNVNVRPDSAPAGHSQNDCGWTFNQKSVQVFKEMV